MQVLQETKVTDLNDDYFRGAWRLKKAVMAYNEDVDKSARIETIKDLTETFNEEGLKKRLGVGPKTVKYFMEALNGTE